MTDIREKECQESMVVAHTCRGSVVTKLIYISRISGGCHMYVGDQC